MLILKLSGIQKLLIDNSNTVSKSSIEVHPTKGSKNFIAIKLSFKKASYEKRKILLKDMIYTRNLIISFILQVFAIFTPKT